MKNLLLISNSTQFGSGYLEHCAEQVKGFFSGVDNILFVPYALQDLEGYADKACGTFAEMGMSMKSCHLHADPGAAVRAAGGLFIGGGNSFRLLEKLYRFNMIDSIRKRVGEGMRYMGASAGTNMACVSIRTTNDMPIVYPPSFSALNLVPFQINPHFVDADPDNQHMGETRETRIAEFHEENAEPVVGLREGAMLQVEGDHMRLVGKNGAKLFRRGDPPLEIDAGSDLSYLLG
ncbi:MAG: dipeptidase PepE [Planctomycetota bacterium]